MVTAASPAPSYTPALYFVRSDSNPALFYTVAQTDDRCACGQQVTGLLHCSCPDHIHRARDCKHVKRVIASKVRPAQVKGQHQPAPRLLRHVPVSDEMRDRLTLLEV